MTENARRTDHPPVEGGYRGAPPQPVFAQRPCSTQELVDLAARCVNLSHGRKISSFSVEGSQLRIGTLVRGMLDMMTPEQRGALHAHLTDVYGLLEVDR